MTRTDVLLATFNGAPFLSELLASLDAQSDQDWTLLARDDYSTDATCGILSNWGSAHPGRLKLVEDGRGNLGALENFGALLSESKNDYFLLCDQDDAWLPEKVKRLKAAMRDAEAKHGRATPIAIHTDLIVADEKLRPIANSYWRYQRLISPKPHAPWKTIVLQNVVTGCAMIGNAALRKAALPVPKDAMMHDWWLALVAAVTGLIINDPTPSVLYRQHKKNTRGAKSWAMRDSVIRVLLSPTAGLRQANFILSGSRRQARCFVARYSALMTPTALRYLEEYGHLGEAGFIARKTFPIRHDLWFDDAVRNAGLLLCI